MLPILVIISVISLIVLIVIFPLWYRLVFQELNGKALKKSYLILLAALLPALLIPFLMPLVLRFVSPQLYSFMYHLSR